MLETTEGEVKIDNPEKLAAQGTQDTRGRQTKQKTQHNPGAQICLFFVF